MDKAPDSLLHAELAQPMAAQDAVLRCQAALLSRSHPSEAGMAFVTELALLLGCHRASVAVLEGEQLLLLASSRIAEIDPRQDAAGAITAAMHEAIDQSLAVAWPQLPAPLAPVALSHQQLAGQGAALSVPLVAQGRVVGALTLERDGGAFSATECALCEHVAGFAAPVLSLQRDRALAWHRRLREDARAWLVTGGRRRAAWAGALVLLAAVLAVPVPWRLSAPARLEGAVQRAVVAASDGYLQQVNVRPGDRVTAGQVLAELASQDLELERRRRESELQQHENAYRAAQARNDRTQMVVSQSRAGEAQAMLALAEGQVGRARIQAPFDGIVIKGDLVQNLGAPVQRGEVLMTLAPSDSFRLIVEVDEADVAAVRLGQKGSLALAAEPGQLLGFTTVRVLPVAAAQEGRNFFEVEATLDAPPAASLRPGLSGVAKIDAGDRALGWLLTHRALAWLRLALWTVVP